MKYDVVVIGSGPGGYVAAVRAAQLGLKTACVEKDKTLGGTCLNVGCIPSKTLLHSSEQYEWIKKESSKQGINCPNATCDLSVMMHRKEQVVTTLVNSVGALFKRHQIAHLQGVAQFTDSHTIKVGSELVQADNFILATGSEPIPLPFLPFDEKLIVSSTGALSLKAVPKKLIVIGAGVIGVELASVYNRLGSEVVIIEMLEKICPLMDDSASKSLLQLLTKQGMTFHLGAKVIQANKQAEKVSLTFEKSGNKQEIMGDVVLVAIGRRPFTQGLGLEMIHLETQKGFVPVDNNFRTSIPHIYAIGDLIEGPMLAHKASEEGVAAAEIIAGHQCIVNYLFLPNVVYTHPEVASVGMTEAEIKALNIPYVVGNVAFRGNSRARCNDDMDGFVKVIGIGPEKYLAGMHIVGPLASEMINSGVIAIKKKATLEEVALLPIAHPTFSEALKEACGQALGIAIHYS